MADIKYRLRLGQRLSEAQIEEIENARNRDIVFDEDSPEIDPVRTPELYEAMMKAVAQRNKRVAGRNKFPA